ncbi:MAG: alpha/beta hydrolase [Microthrixaceae bacterium]
MALSRRTVLRSGLGLGVGVGLGAVTAGLVGCSGDESPRAEASTLPEVEGARRLTYGEAPSQWLDIAFPQGDPGEDAESLAPALVVLIHGGFWQDRFGADLMTPLARDLLRRGYVVANLEYRRLGERGGGWPGTLADVAAGVDRLATAGDDLGRAMPSRVVTIGHSAGGQLAVWAAARRQLTDDQVGAQPKVLPTATVSLAGVLDLRAAAADDLGDGAVVDLMGGEPIEHPDRYAAASPRGLLPLGLPTLCVHGTADQAVPVSQSESYVDAAVPLGDDATLAAIRGADHLVLIDPTAEPWRTVTDWLGGTVPG